MNKPTDALQSMLYRAADTPSVSGWPTGFSALDSILPGAGWPRGCVTDLLIEYEGIGELSLLMPALSKWNRESHWVAWIAPPYIPYAPALAAQGLDLSRQLLIQTANKDDCLWSLEQVLRSGICGAVLAWPEDIDYRRLRRLQLAAAAGASSAFLFRPLTAEQKPSPAALRLRLSIQQRDLRVDILKCRGNISAQRLRIGLEAVV